MDETIKAPLNQYNIPSMEPEQEHMNENLTFAVLPYDLQSFITNTGNPDYFSTILPEEIILYIFKFLSIKDLRNCAKVSKYWLMLSSSAVLYRDVTFYGARVEVTFLERILNCNAQAINLKFMKIIDQTSAIQPFFKTQRFNSLQKIAVCRSTIKFELIEELISSSPNLKELKLEFSSGTTLGTTFFRHVVKLQFLKNLDLRSSKINDIPEIVNVFKKADKFKELKILSLSSILIINASIFAQPREFLECLLYLCPHLEVLKLPNQNINSTAFGLILGMKHLKDLNISESNLYTNFTLPIIENSEKWINLRQLDITDVYSEMPERTNEILLRLSPNLEFLQTEGVIKISTFKQILRLENLMNLYISDADLTDLNNFRSYAKFNKLQCLSLYKDEECRRPFLSNLLRLLRLEKLRELTLSGFVFNGDILRSILEMKNLEKMDLMYIKTSRVFNAEYNLADSRLEKVKYLSLTFIDRRINPILAEVILLSCQNVTNLEMALFPVTEGIWRSILSMTELEQLHLYDMDANNINYVPGSISNSQKFPKLKSLLLDYATHENNPRRLEAIIPLCSSIHELSLYRICLTNYICKSLAFLKELKMLYLTDVSEISSDKINYILNGCPNLTRNNIKVINRNRLS